MNAKRWAIAIAMTAGCEPVLDQRLSIIEAPRVLAVISDPAEARPQQSASHRVWIAGPSGTLEVEVDWAFCTEPKPPTEDNVVNARCLGSAVRAIGRGATMTAATPSDACMRFGPDIGNAEYRPRDPDITGGYYQPIRLTLPAQFGEAIAFASHRIGCGLANAPIDVVREFRNRYVANSNPPAPMLARADGGPADQARVGEQVQLIASWPQDAAEPYLGFDAASAQLRDRRESLRVSWYASAGRFCSDATGAPEPEPGQTPEADTGNCWEAPTEPGPVAMWLVLRDSRGGAAVREVSLEVLP